MAETEAVRDPKKLRMFTLVKDTIPPGFAINSTGHATLACYLKFQDDPVMKEWLAHSFSKVTCKVNEAEFEKAKQCEGIVVITESALDRQEVAVCFKPRYEWPNVVKFAKKWTV